MKQENARLQTARPGSPKPDTGNLRETFFFSQTEVRHQVAFSRFGDFTLDDAYTFEIGGPSKTPEQIRRIPNAYIVADGIKGGAGKNTALAFRILILTCLHKFAAARFAAKMTRLWARASRFYIFSIMATPGNST